MRRRKGICLLPILTGGLPGHDLNLLPERTHHRHSCAGTQGTLLLSVRTTPHFIELDPDQFLGYLKEEGLEKVIEWRSPAASATPSSRSLFFHPGLPATSTASLFPLRVLLGGRA